jgi:flagellar basal-body rod modification protein FlgD
MAVNAVTQNTNNQALIDSINAKAGASSAASATEDLNQRFLALLTAQLQNQDPMNPMDNAEMTSQLAQLSTVEGVNKMNASLQQLLSALSMDSTLRSAVLIGKDVMVEDEQLLLAEGNAQGGIDLASAADKVVVEILDGSGSVVRRIDLGEQAQGFSAFSWDGKDAQGEDLAAGSYQYRVVAAQGEEAVEATTYSLGTVSSVNAVAGSTTVTLAGLGEHPLTAIRSVQ